MLRKVIAVSIGLSQVLTPAYAANGGYVFRKSHGVIQYTPTDTPADTAIPDVRLAAMEGNASGPVLASTSPLQSLAAISAHLKGGVSSVVFEGYEPEIAGLRMDMSTGAVGGVPQSPFDGRVFVRYHDGEGRPGRVELPVKLFPYPTLKAVNATAELPRMSHAQDYGIAVSPSNSGFFKGVSYSLAPGSDPLPEGVTISDGVLTGTVTAQAGPARKVVVRGTSLADSSVFADVALNITVTDPVAMTLDVRPDAPLVWKYDEATAKVTERQGFDPAPAPQGSYASPVTWSLEDAPAWMGIDRDGQLTGTPPGRGTFTAKVKATDAQNRVATDTVTVKATLPGYVFLSPGAQFVKARAGETFATAAQTVTGYVGSYTFETVDVPPEVTFDTTSGVFTGRFDTPDTYTWRLHVVDEDGRRDADGALSNTNYVQQATVFAPVALGAATSVDGGLQDSGGFSVLWPAPSNVIGKAEYTVTGDVPGTLYYKVYDGGDSARAATYVNYAADGTSTSVRQAAGETAAQTEAKLAYDRIVFDPATLTLKGTPSRAGRFDIALDVTDDHVDKGYNVNPSDLGRDTSNAATSPYSSVTVRASTFFATNVYGDTETLGQFTSQARLGIALRQTASNAAYKNGSSWAQTAGTLPPGMTAAVTPDTDVLYFTGYPTEQGTFAGNVFRATDANGVSVTSKPITFTVGPRVPLALTASAPSQTLRTGEDVTTKIAMTGAPYGETVAAAGWTVTGTVPDGVTWTVANNVLSFSGKPLKTGTYDISVAASDSRGGTAGATARFVVQPSFISYNNGGNAVTLRQYTDSAANNTIIRHAASNETYTGALTWAMVSGTLPPGITTSFSRNGVQLDYAGSPTELGTWNDVVWKVTDANGNSLTTTPVSFNVIARSQLALVATPGNFVSMVVGTAATARLTATGVPAGENLSNWVVSGTIPDGITYQAANNAITFSGTPSVSGSFPISVRVRDSRGGDTTATVTLKIGVGLISYNNGCCTDTLQQYTSKSVMSTAVRVAASNDLYRGGATFTLAAGTLPPGVTMTANADGSGYYYGGYATETGTWSGIVWKVTDPYGNEFLTQPVSFVVGPRAPLALSAASGDTRQMIVSTDDALLTVKASNVPNGGSIPTANWTVTGTLPPGVSRTAKADGLYFTGKATAVGTYVVTVGATDALGATATYQVTFNVTATGLFKLTNSATTQTVQQVSTKATISTAARLTSTNALYPVTWTLASGTLPPGVTATPSADGTTLVYGGYPTTTGTFGNIVWIATDASGNQATTAPVSFTVTARAALALAVSPTSLTQTLVSGKTAATMTVTVSGIPMGGTGADIDWTVNPSRGMPAGITWAVTGNVLRFSGITAQANDWYGIYVTATDATGAKVTTGSLAFTVTSPFGSIGGLIDQSNRANVVCQGDCYYYPRTETLKVGVTYPTLHYSMRDGGNSLYAITGFSLKQGTLPPGITATLSADKLGFQFAGKPTAKGTWTVVYWVTDRNGVSIQLPSATFVVTD